jgi:hypothetical protein
LLPLWLQALLLMQLVRLQALLVEALEAQAVAEVLGAEAPLEMQEELGESHEDS